MTGRAGPASLYLIFVRVCRAGAKTRMIMMPYGSRLPVQLTRHADFWHPAACRRPVLARPGHLFMAELGFPEEMRGGPARGGGRPSLVFLVSRW